ncbi:hypothetical protein AAAC51_20060 [Priestia megaterium]
MQSQLVSVMTADFCFNVAFLLRYDKRKDSIPALPSFMFHSSCGPFSYFVTASRQDVREEKL